jgi:hypothetical protein
MLAAPNITTNISIHMIIWNKEETGLNGSEAYPADREAMQGQELPADRASLHQQQQHQFHIGYIGLVCLFYANQGSQLLVSKNACCCIVCGWLLFVVCCWMAFSFRHGQN